MLFHSISWVWWNRYFSLSTARSDTHRASRIFCRGWFLGFPHRVLEAPRLSISLTDMIQTPLVSQKNMFGAVPVFCEGGPKPTRTRMRPKQRHIYLVPTLGTFADTMHFEVAGLPLCWCFESAGPRTGCLTPNNVWKGRFLRNTSRKY